MIIIGSDHSGVELKEKIEKYLENKHIEYTDIMCNCNSSEDDYPDIAQELCSKVLENNSNLGIVICGTGIGVSIASNKVKGIRAALCTDSYMAKMARNHNNANVLCLGARLEVLKDEHKVEVIVQAFLDNFFEGGRHDRRVNKITEIENNRIEGDK